MGRGRDRVEVRRNVDTQREPTAIEEVLHWILITALHDKSLLAVKGKLLKELRKNEDVAALQADDCDKETLLNLLAFAQEL